MTIYGRRGYDDENVQWAYLAGLLEKIEIRVDALTANNIHDSAELRGIKEQLHKVEERLKLLEKFREPFVVTRRILLLSVAGLMTCSGIVSAIIIIHDKLF